MNRMGSLVVPLMKGDDEYIPPWHSLSLAWADGKRLGRRFTHKVQVGPGASVAQPSKFNHWAVSLSRRLLIYARAFDISSLWDRELGMEYPTLSTFRIVSTAWSVASLLSMDDWLRLHHVFYRPRCLIRAFKPFLLRIPISMDWTSGKQWILPSVCDAVLLFAVVILRPFARRFPMYMIIGLPSFPRRRCHDAW
jgi:hypothetical protein